MSASHSALVQRALHIDPLVLGQRIRSARAEAGLTQANVAQRAMSPAYLSRIETGDRRPTFPILEHIAYATGVSLEALLFGTGDDDQSELRLRLVQAEQSLVADDPGRALILALKVGDDADAIRLVEVAERALLIRASALLRMARPQAAIPLLESLVNNGRASATSVRARAALCRCYIDTGRAREALRVAEEAQQLIADHRLDRLPEALDLSIEHASVYLRLGDQERAVEIWRSAREIALFSDLDEVRGAYLDASERASRDGAFEQAWQHAERASALAELRTFQDNLQRPLPDGTPLEGDKRPAPRTVPGPRSG